VGLGSHLPPGAAPSRRHERCHLHTTMLGPLMFRRDRVDADAARQALWTGAVRTAIGIGVLLSPGRLLRSWGFPDQESRSGSVKALLRVLKGRDIVLGLATLAARDKPAALRTMVAASAAVDTGDTAVSLCLATASPGARRPAIVWTLVGIPFSALGWRIRERL
jgi:Domain of unknown function (DUF4267)